MLCVELLWNAYVWAAFVFISVPLVTISGSRSNRLHVLENFCDDVVRSNAFAEALEVDEDPVTQDVRCDGS